MMSGLITKSRIRRFAVLAFCAAPIILAFGKASQPIVPQLDAPIASDIEPGQAGIFDRPPHDKAEAERQRALHPGPVSEDEWLSAEEFLKAHAPVRYEVIVNKEKQIPSGEVREGLKRFLVNKTRGIAQLQGQSPELYKTRVRTVEVDDEVFGICLKLKHNRNDKQAQAELNARITELFNLGLTERHQRIKLVENSLVDQKKSLETDEHDKAHLIQQYYETVLTRGVEGARLDIHRPGKSKPDASTSPSSPGEDK